MANMIPDTGILYQIDLNEKILDRIRPKQLCGSDYSRWADVGFEELRGRVIDEIFRIHENLIFRSGTDVFKLYHYQDCCEHVEIEDIVGDLDDLIGNPILVAEERSNDGECNEDESSTWTFYEIATIKGSVTIRWFGTSNGYYSEGVDFVRADLSGFNLS